MIKPLTSIRFVFALMVFTHHLDFTRPQADSTWRWLLDNVFNEGYVGVTFFFILSGFILSYTYKQKFLEKKVTYHAFILSRVARIYPMHLLTMLVVIPIVIRESEFLNAGDFFIHLVPNAAMVQSFIPIESYYFSFNTLSWSISDEMFFYALFPALLLLLCSIRKVVAFVIICVLVLSVPILMTVVNIDDPHYFFYINPLVRLADFVLGIGIFFIFENARAGHVDRINFNAGELLSVVALLVFFAFHDGVPQIFRYSFYYWLPISVVILGFSFQRGFISRFLSIRILVLLGEVSFSFYLLHLIVVRYFLAVNGRFLHIDNTYVVVLLIFSVATLLSYCSFAFIERPLYRYFRKRVDLERMS